MEKTAIRPSSRRWLCTAGLLIIVVLASNSQLLRGKAAPQWDAVNFFAPAFSLVADNATARRLLLWNPWTAAGSPDFAEPELGTTSPIMLLVAVVSPNPEAGFVIYWMLIWVGAGLGMLLFAKHLRCPPWGAVISALGFVASGFFLGHAQHISSLFSVAFLPWICWRFDDALLTRRYWSAVQAGVVYGLSALGGYPQFTILTPGFLALWAVGRIFFSEDEPPKGGALKTPTLMRRILLAVGVLAVVGLVGGLIFCPPYASMMTETRGYSDRIGERVRTESIGSNVLPAGAITTLASPYLFLLSHPGVPGHLWPISDISMSNIYAGAGVTVLAFLALLYRSRWRYWLGLVALFFLSCSLGNQLPIRGWLYDLVPPTRYFRGASMFSAYTIFLTCILAALAARDLENWVEGSDRLFKNFFFAAAAIAVTAGFSFLVDIHQVQAQLFRYHLGIAHLIIVWTGVALCAGLLYARRVTVLRCSQMLVLIALVDASAAILISAPVMYSTSTVAWWKLMTRQHNPSLNLTAHGFYRQLLPPKELTEGSVVNNRNLVVKVAVLESYVTLTNRFQLLSDLDPMLQKFALGNDRIWFSGQPLMLPPSNSNFAAYTAAVHELPTPPMVLHTPGQMMDPSLRSLPSSISDTDDLTHSNHPMSPAQVDLLTYFPNRIAFQYRAPSDGWLLVTDRWARAWNAEVNGRSVAVFGANFLFRAVPVRRGDNTVLLRYQPHPYVGLVMLSWGILGLVGLSEIVRFTLSKRSDTHQEAVSSPVGNA